MGAKAGWALALLGGVLAILGAAVMVMLGPDNRMTTGPHAIETDAVAVVATPSAIRWADVQLDVLVEVPVRKPVFLGIGNAVDVQDFVASTRRLEITGFQRPWDVKTREVDGKPNLPGAPTAIDWWIDSSAGLGGATISTRLPDESVSIAVLSVGSSNLAGLEVTLAYGVKGGFAKGLALLLFGAGLIWLGLLVRRGRPAHQLVGDVETDADEMDEPGDIEEDVVYVFVDEDGVEHEVSEDELADFEIVDEEGKP